MMRCPICREERELEMCLATKDWRFGTTDQTFQVVRWRSCQVAFTWPRCSRKEQSAYYPQDYYQKETMLGSIGVPLMRLLQGVMAEQRARSAEKLLGLERRAITILDIGCGRGDFLKRMSRRGWHTYGVEPSPTLSDPAVEDPSHGSAPTIDRGFIEDVSLPDSFFHVITLWHVIEHVDDPVWLLEQAHRALKDDGLLMIAVPNFRSLEARCFGKYWLGLDTPRHLFHFSAESIRQLVERAGFRVEVQRSSVLDTPLSSWYSAIYALRAWLGLKTHVASLGGTLVTIVTLPLVVLPTVLTRMYSLFFPGELIELYCRKAAT
jgi:2-polyprenyl-3-methyl-5-hydroxy-6-metoxy-1,4-benzoquinol methylase